MKRKKDTKWIKSSTFKGSHIRDLVRKKDPRLPSPEEVAQSLKNLRISILLDNGTVSFFKKEAKRLGVSYQQMIRQILKHYVAEMKKAA